MSEHNEEYIKEAIKKTGLEQPSEDFLDRVMDTIAVSDKAVAYKSLISAKGWLAIAATTVIFVVCSYYLTNDLSFFGWEPGELFAYSIPDISGKIALSTNALYGLLFTSLIVLLQIPILTSWHHNAMWKNRE